MRRKSVFILALLLLVTMFVFTVNAAQPTLIYVNGELIEPDVPAQIIDDRLMVPVRFIAESLGAEVEYDGVKNTVTISAPEDSNSYNLIKLNGERTTWPYWIEGDKLYLEQRNCIEMLRSVYKPQWHNVNIFSDGTVSIDHKNIKVDTKQIDGFTAIYINDLKRLKIIDYDWDIQTGNIVLKPQ
jgi:hypothetical protein